MSRPLVTVVGIGPAGPELITAEAGAAIEASEHRYLRTSRHPSSVAVANATTFDDIYEQSDTFDDVYRRIVETLVADAASYGEILYAVPGSPWVLERTVRDLRANDRVEVRVVAGLSFLDLAYDRLGIDPVEAGLRLVDAHTFATSAAGEVGPLLVPHCHNQRVLSDIKLAVRDEPSQPLTVLQRLGLPDEAVFTVEWSDLDRAIDADHLTSIYIPTLSAPVGRELLAFHDVVRRLRQECPWDRKQTHVSLTRYAIEETYELVEAIHGGDDEALEEELGDVLLQVFLHSAIAEQEGRFSVADVAETVTTKMIRRHPHVFGDTVVNGTGDVVANWGAIKAEEKRQRGVVAAGDADIDGHLPALAHARQVSAAAAKSGREWSNPSHSADPSDIESIGDALFALADLARRLEVDPETALRLATARFRRAH